MNLSGDQLFEVLLALHFGCQDRSWLPEQRRNELVAFQQTILARRRADPATSESQLSEIEDHFARDPADEERAMRERYYGQPEKIRTRNLSGTKQAINDLLSQAQFFELPRRAVIDRRLAAKQLPSLRQLEIGMRQKHAKILKRGKIRSEEEFYLVQEVLASVDFDITEADRTEFQQMATAFEKRTEK